MKVKLAKTAGFCYGVERAVNTVYDEIRSGQRIYTYGPIVHNDMVVEDLRKQGVGVITDLDDLRARIRAGELENTAVIIRAHGVGQEVMDVLTSAGDIRIVDATCPFVKKIHDIVKEHYAAGERIIITGTKTHPEVQGILGQISGDASVVENTDEAYALADDPAVRNASEEGCRFCLVSQTTFNTEKFKDIVDIFKKKLYYVTVVNTICNATQLRQKEALALSRECDAMIVIGGKHSSNTAKLYDICSKECSATYFIESLDDLNETIDQSVRCFGITAGASTPKTIIQEVLKYVRDEF